METIIHKYAGKCNTKHLVKVVEDIRTEYLEDGFTTGDVPPIVGRLVMEVSSFKGIAGPIKKKLVIGILNHLTENSELESTLKAMIPPIVDGFALMMKAKAQAKVCFPCIRI